jgi:hypothetical protein
MSLAASRAMDGDRVGKRRSARFTISVIQVPYATSARAIVMCTRRQSLTTRRFAPRALLTAGGEPRRKPADVIVLGAGNGPLLSAAPTAPGRSCGQGDRGHIRSALGADAPRPPIARVALALSERRARPVDQQGAQIAVPALGDAE